MIPKSGLSRPNQVRLIPITCQALKTYRRDQEKVNQCTLSGIGFCPGKVPAGRAGVTLCIQEDQSVPDSGEVRGGDEGSSRHGLAATQGRPGGSVAPNHQDLGLYSSFRDRTQQGTGTETRPDRDHIVRLHMGKHSPS